MKTYHSDQVLPKPPLVAYMNLNIYESKGKLVQSKFRTNAKNERKVFGNCGRKNYEIYKTAETDEKGSEFNYSSNETFLD